MITSTAILRMMLIVMLLIVPHRHAVAGAIDAPVQGCMAGECAAGRSFESWGGVCDLDDEDDVWDVERDTGDDVDGETPEVPSDADEAVIDAAPSTPLNRVVRSAVLPIEMQAQSGPLQTTRPPQT